MGLNAFDETLPKALRFLRLKAELTQTELAKRARITPSMVSNYERGHEQPTLATLIKLLEALDSDFSELHEAVHVLTEHWKPEAKDARQASIRGLLYQLLGESDL